MKLLLSSLGFLGHLRPAEAFVRAAVAAGHAVRWHVPPAEEARVVRAGADPLPYRATPLHDDYTPAPLEDCIRRFERAAEWVANDLDRACEAEVPDLLLADPAMVFGAERVAAERGLRWGMLSVLPLLRPDPAIPLIIQASHPACEWAWDVPSLNFCGPLTLGPERWEPPPWWHKLDPHKPWVAVSQGTVASDPRRLIIPTIDALTCEPVEVLVQSGIGDFPGLARQANVHYAPWFSWPDVLPRVACFVTNGGYGGVTEAWKAGCPMVVAGDTEDKPQVAERVDWVTGTGLKVDTVTPAAIRRAVQAVVNAPRFRAASTWLANAINESGDSAARAVAICERYVAQQEAA